MLSNYGLISGGKKKSKKYQYSDIFIPINFLTTNMFFDHC